MDKLPQRFRDKVIVNEDGCWIWVAYRNKHGYGRFSFHAKTFLTHRFAYEAIIGAIPPGMVIDHYRINVGPRNSPCSTSCCNPDHLEVVTQKNNVKRGIAGHPGRKRKQPHKTHCCRGHIYSEDNSYQYVKPSGGTNIKCRVCDRERKSRHK